MTELARVVPESRDILGILQGTQRAVASAAITMLEQTEFGFAMPVYGPVVVDWRLLRAGFEVSRLRGRERFTPSGLSQQPAAGLEATRLVSGAYRMTDTHAYRFFGSKRHNLPWHRDNERWIGIVSTIDDRKPQELAISSLGHVSSGQIDDDAWPKLLAAREGAGPSSAQIVETAQNYSDAIHTAVAVVHGMRQLHGVRVTAAMLQNFGEQWRAIQTFHTPLAGVASEPSVVAHNPAVEANPEPLVTAAV